MLRCSAIALLMSFEFNIFIDLNYIHTLLNVYIFEQGDVTSREMIAVKRLIGVVIPVEKFKMEAEQLISMDHKNIVKVAGYCHDQSREHRLVHFKGKPIPQLFNGAEQLLCYEYMHNGSLREYLIGMTPTPITNQLLNY